MDMIEVGSSDGKNSGLIGLGRSSPAKELVPLRRRGIAAGGLLLIIGGICVAPALTVEILLGSVLVLVAILALFRAGLAYIGLRRTGQPAIAPAALSDDDLPSYTILAPLYHESNVVASLIRHLSRLDYPADRLEILLICEVTDVDTIQAVRAAALDERFRLVIAPDGEPRTKPRACNLALLEARGDLCVIYDAEDRPAPDQLRLAARTFAASPPSVICLQARLDFYNASYNWLTRCFTLEYAYWFELLLPGLAALGLPVPLGGTSNHFLVKDLRALGGWDPYNVTEDVDLGMRIHLAGAQTQLLDSTTLEEACSNRSAWIRQRSRWIKGYLQTWLVHTRSPLFKNISWRERGAFRVLIGGEAVLSALFPLVLASPIVSIGLLLTGSNFLPAPFLLLTIAAATAINVMSIYSAAVAAIPQRRLCLAAAVVITPAYTVLAAIATYRAIWQLFRRPHFWEKTPHGLLGSDTDPGLQPRLP